MTRKKYCCECTPWCNVCTDRSFDLSTMDLQFTLTGITTGSPPDAGCLDCTVLDGPWSLTQGGIPTCGSLTTTGPPVPSGYADWEDFFGVTSIEWLEETEPSPSPCDYRLCCWGAEVSDASCESGNGIWYVTVTFVVVDGTDLGLFVRLHSSGFTTLPGGAGLLIVATGALQFDCSAAWDFSVTITSTVAGTINCSLPTSVDIVSI
jgi:hypothetical protein